MSTNRRAFGIIGGGVFGLSTALHILKAYPNADITIFDYILPGAPSDDGTKILRPDYPDLDRMISVISTRDEMMRDPLLSPFLYKVGRILIWDEKNIPTLDAINVCRSQRGLEKRERLDRTVLNGFYGTSHLPGGPVYTHNNDDLVMVWRDGIMKAIKNDILHRSQKSPELTIREVLVENLICEGGRITDIVLATGEKVDSRHMEVVLAAGPWTSDVLDRSGMEQPDHSRVPVATAIFSYLIRISKDQTGFLTQKPIISDLGICEFLPPIGEEGAKINYIMPCSNFESGSFVSRPKDLSRSSLAIQCMLEVVEKIRKYILPDKLEVTSCRACWDGINASQNPIIARHPHYVNFTIGAGGSFTFAKDIYVGRDVVKVLDGAVLPKMGWGPIAASANDNQPLLLPKGNFHDLEIKAEQDPKVRKWKVDNQGLQTWWAN